MVKTLKYLLLRNQKADDLETWYTASGLQYCQVCLRVDPRLTLTYFMARSNLVLYAIVWEKGKTMDFSETIVICYLKLAKMTEVTRKFFWHQHFVPWGLSGPVPGLYTYIKSCKKKKKKTCIESDFKELVLKRATNDQSDKMIWWHKNFVPKGLSAPHRGIYMYKIIVFFFFFFFFFN